VHSGFLKTILDNSIQLLLKNTSVLLTQFDTIFIFFNNPDDDNTIEGVEKVGLVKVGHLWLEKVNTDMRKCDESPYTGLKRVLGVEDALRRTQI